MVVSPTIRYLPKREHGTDGLMGRLPFGIDGDGPLVRAERRDKFIIDDEFLPVRAAPLPMRAAQLSRLVGLAGARVK